MPTREERADRPGKHVTRAGRGEPRVALIRDEQMAFDVSDDRRRSLQQHHGAGLGREDPRGIEAIIGGWVAGQELVLAVVRGQDGRVPAPPHDLEVAGHREEPVTVEDERDLGAAHHVMHRRDRVLGRVRDRVRRPRS